MKATIYLNENNKQSNTESYTYILCFIPFFFSFHEDLNLRHCNIHLLHFHFHPKRYIKSSTALQPQDVYHVCKDIFKFWYIKIIMIVLSDQNIYLKKDLN